MKKLSICVLILLVAAACNDIKKYQMRGTYKYLDKGELSDDYTLEVSESMATYKLTVFAASEISSEYKIEEGYLYLTSPQMPLRFKIASSDTLVLENSFFVPGGKYVREN